MSFRTTPHIETSMEKMQEVLHFKNEPKWYVIRFAIFVSLSIESRMNLDLDADIDFTGGIEYKSVNVLGRTKTDINGLQGDYTDLIGVMVSNAHNCKIDDVNALEKLLEKHCVRGFQYLENSLNEKSSIFVWLLNEFNLSSNDEV